MHLFGARVLGIIRNIVDSHMPFRMRTSSRLSKRRWVCCYLDTLLLNEYIGLLFCLPALRERRLHWCKFPTTHVPIFLAYIHESGKTALNLYLFVHVFSRRKRKGGEDGSNRTQMQWLEYQTEKRRHH